MMVFVIIIDHDHDHNHALLMITKMVIMKIFWCSFTAGYGFGYGYGYGWQFIEAKLWLHWCSAVLCKPSKIVDHHHWSSFFSSKSTNDNFRTSGSLTVQGMDCHSGATGEKKLRWFDSKPFWSLGHCPM